MRKILIIGATSAIAQAAARRFADAGDALFLVARNAHKLAATADDLVARGTPSIHTEATDALDYSRHRSLIDAAVGSLGGLDIVLIAHGTLPNQKDCEQSFELVREAYEVNVLTTISLLTHSAGFFERQGRGTIAVITSVAGDRGRQSNYIYGSAKGAVTIFLQGLRNRLYKSGVHVLTIKPGFVDTPMTAGLAKGLLWARPDQIAVRILSAIDNGRDIVYAPWYWRVIMLIIKMIPERIFKRLDL